MNEPRNSADDPRDLVKGTLDMLILKALEVAPTHGWGVADRIETLSRGVFSLQTGTLYPALHRLLRKGWVAADWRITDNARRARYYRLTPAGRRQLDEKRTSWLRATMAVKRILDATAEEA